jgi:hypothetical protein
MPLGRHATAQQATAPHPALGVRPLPRAANGLAEPRILPQISLPWCALRRPISGRSSALSHPHARSIIGMPMQAPPIPPPPVAAAGDDGPVAQPPAVATAVIVARRNEAAMVHVANAVMATVMGKTRVANAVDREVMAAAAKVPVTAMTMATSMAMTTSMTMTTSVTMATSMPGIGRVMGSGKHQHSRHQHGRGEQLFHHGSTPCPVQVGWQFRCNAAEGKPRNVAPVARRGGGSSPASRQRAERA